MLHGIRRRQQNNVRHLLQHGHLIQGGAPTAQVGKSPLAPSGKAPTIIDHCHRYDVSSGAWSQASCRPSS